MPKQNKRPTRKEKIAAAKQEAPPPGHIWVVKPSPYDGTSRRLAIRIDGEQLDMIRMGAKPTNVAPHLKAHEVLWIEQGITPEESARTEEGIQHNGLGLTIPSPKPRSQS